MKSPKPPDPYATSAAQQRGETNAAYAQSIIGNPNVYTPYGSQTYSIAGWEQVPDAQGRMIQVPRYNQTQQLSPDQMKLLGLNTQSQYNLGQTAVEQSAKLRGLLGKSVDTAGTQGWRAAAAPGQVRQDQAPTNRAAIEAAMMGRQNRDMATQNAAQQAQLAARGMNVGSAQYGTVQEQQDRARADAVQQSYLASGGESRAAQEAYNQAALQKYQMGSDWATQLNNLRQAQMQERLALRNQPLNEISALLSGSQVTTPSFNPFQSQGINAPNIAGAINQNYQQQAQQANAFNSGIFGLGSSLLGGIFGSDRRLKEEIIPIKGRKLAGAQLYRFRYKANPAVVQLGVMADEVRPLHPDAVTEIDGYDHVNYALLFSRHEGG